MCAQIKFASRLQEMLSLNFHTFDAPPAIHACSHTSVATTDAAEVVLAAAVVIVFAAHPASTLLTLRGRCCGRREDRW